jgi:hypothetical protein
MSAVMPSPRKKTGPQRASVGLLALGALHCACGFPQVSFTTEPLGDASSSLDARAAGDDGEASADGQPIEDSPIVADAPPALDAPQDTAIDALAECDQDGDGYLAKSAMCNGTDCCDTDFNANPGQKQFFGVPDRCASFDYDCDGVLETEYPINIMCSGLATACQGGSGFTSDPACGTSAPYSTCGPSGLGCAPSSTMMTVQGCR